MTPLLKLEYTAQYKNRLSTLLIATAHLIYFSFIEAAHRAHAYPEIVPLEMGQ